MSIETETAGDTTTIEHYGHEWTVPTKRHLSHLRAMKAELRQGLQLTTDFLAELFLGPEQFAKLLEMNPVEGPELDEFGRKIAAALGLGDEGNS